MKITMQPEKSTTLQKDKLTDQVMDIIMKWIMTGKLNMGDRLNANEIAQTLNVSRMPVREALCVMEEKKLAQSIPYAGMRLVKLTENDIQEIYLARQALEPLAAKYACMKMNMKGIKDLTKINRDYQKIVSQDSVDPNAVYNQNRLYHFTIYKISGLTRINNIIEQLWDQLAFFKLIFGHKLLETEESKKQLIHEHQSYLDALIEKDPEKIYALMYATLGRRIENIPYSIKEYEGSEIGCCSVQDKNVKEKL